ncbi:transcriptional regulator [Kamptonema sp. UHCC 0994]|uniref:P-II family nitrogen regulator n=1 Tax=Kamptonema sp. UHCC 0994 TaxID=3031329 RepID=UPI0023BABA77|nr:transcriptional regulator [Kamptonema sp. UHCC 0994]MDF0556631.1 transcriptional regulator [Kamptonema sp. UHCC 0994]
MDTIKRIEIVVPAIELKPVVKRLEKLGIIKYNIIRQVIGRGEFGESSDDLDAQLSSVYILTTCLGGQEDSVFLELQPILQKYGGVFLVSDAVCYRC